MKIKDPKLDEDEMIKSADYEVKSRDVINNYGSQYGITNDMIGWNRTDPNSNGMITLGGQDFMAPDRLENGSSWNSNDSIRGALDLWAKQRGIESSTVKNDLSNHGYSPDKYSAKIDGLLDSIMNAKPFSYNAESDPSFQAYRDQYGRAGDKALTNTMSEASSLSGGRLNSWAVSAGNQAKASYDQELMNIIPQLEQMAYGRHQGDLSNSRANLNTLMDFDDNDYRRAIDSRQFGYGVDRDQLEDSRYNDDKSYNRKRDVLADERYDDTTSYNRTRDTIGDDQWRSSFDETVRSNKDSSARGWASHNQGVTEFNYQKEQDTLRNELVREQWEFEKAGKETGADPQTLGKIYSSMYSAVDEDGNKIEPADWLVTNAEFMENNELLAIQKLLPKNESAIDKWLMAFMASRMGDK